MNINYVLLFLCLPLCAMDQQNHFDRLPNELITTIFDHVLTTIYEGPRREFFGTCRTIILTNKRWNALAHDFFINHNLVIRRKSLVDYSELLDAAVKLHAVKWIEKALEKDKTLVHAPNILYYTPLHTAAIFNSVDVAHVLLQHGAEINMKGGPFNNETPLLLTVQCSAFETMKLLMESGADATIGDGKHTLLEIAERNYRNAKKLGSRRKENAKKIYDLLLASTIG